MSGIIATNNGGGDFELPKAGSYIARCFKIVDIGTQETSYLGNTKMKHQILVWFELLEDEDGTKYRMEDGETPFTVMQKYTLSTNAQATLRKHIDAWRGKALTTEEAAAFDVTNLLDKSCRLQLTLDEKNDRTYVNIANIGYTKKEPKGVNKTFWWSIAEPDMEEYKELPEWLQNKIKDAEEWAEMATGKVQAKDVVPTEVPDGDVDMSGVDETDLDVGKIKF